MTKLVTIEISDTILNFQSRKYICINYKLTGFYTHGSHMNTYIYLSI